MEDIVTVPELRTCNNVKPMHRAQGLTRISHSSVNEHGRMPIPGTTPRVGGMSSPLLSSPTPALQLIGHARCVVGNSS